MALKKQELNTQFGGIDYWVDATSDLANLPTNNFPWRARAFVTGGDIYVWNGASWVIINSVGAAHVAQYDSLGNEVVPAFTLGALSNILTVPAGTANWQSVDIPDSAQAIYLKVATAAANVFIGVAGDVTVGAAGSGGWNLPIGDSEKYSLPKITSRKLFYYGNTAVISAMVA